MFEYLYGYDENGEAKDYYDFRTHEDNNKQQCPYCGNTIEFYIDRCSLCSNQ